MSKKHVPLPGSNRPKNKLAVKVGPVDPKRRIEVTITLKGPKLPDADFVPAGPLTPAEMAAQYGAKQEDADRVARSLETFGLKVEEVSLPTRSMRVSGTAKAFEAAFKPALSNYRSPEQGEYIGRAGKLMVPAELRGLVQGVFGLDGRRMARRKILASVVPPGISSAAPLGPADLEKLYDFPPGDAAGQKVAIAEFGGGYFVEDVTAFCQKFGLTQPAVQAVSVNAPAYTLSQVQALPAQQRKQALDISMEVTMDVQIVAGFCPRAAISVYFATFDQKGWVDLLNQVIGDQPVSLSISWGLAEDDPDWSSAAVAAINDRLNQARLLGITVCLSSGDDGSGDQLTDGRAHVNFPASSPFVLSVGGTMLQGAAGQVNEVTWWQSPGTRAGGGGATGGGVSVVFDRPAWQSVKVKSLNRGSRDGRVVPDVAALAGDPLYDLFYLEQPFPDGGTSASAPLWAALIARLNALLPAGKQQRFLTPLLYAAGAGGKPLGRSGLRDITAGNNASQPQPGKGYKAGAGYDAVTGWGVPDGAALLAALLAV